MCCVCYECPVLRRLFPRVRYNRLGENPANFQPPAPDRATTARPGSAEKLAVMIRRAERGEHIHHPGDFRLERLKAWEVDDDRGGEDVAGLG